MPRTNSNNPHAIEESGKSRRPKNYRTKTQRERYDMGRKVYEAHLLGFGFRQIADRFNDEARANGKPERSTTYYYQCFTEFEKTIDRESVDQIKWLVAERTEFIYTNLVQGVRKGNARSAEVALQALKGLREMFGLDYSDRKQESVQQQAIVINIAPHPDDPEAQRIVAEINQPHSLQSPATGLLLPEANYGAGGRDGFGQDLDGAEVGLEATPGPEEPDD